ncbi:hypothetical protein T492DRAFT_900314, partial [Pavlovales sp. CCMP2436]
MAELLDLPAELLALVATRLPRDGELAASLSCRELRQAVAAARLSDGLTRTTTRIRSAFDSSLRKLEWAIACGLPRTFVAGWLTTESGRLSALVAAAEGGGRLSVLQWARASGCPCVELGHWALPTLPSAAATDVLRWAHTNGCPWGWWEHEDACLAAAGGGHLATLQWLRVNGYRRWRGGGHLDVLTWLRAVDCPWGEGSDTCRQREGISSMLDPSLVVAKRTWALDEDRALVKMVRLSGPHGWAKLANGLQGRVFGLALPGPNLNGPNASIGSIEAKLNTVKPIRGIVIGAFGEVSADTHSL